MNALKQSITKPIALCLGILLTAMTHAAAPVNFTLDVYAIKDGKYEPVESLSQCQNANCLGTLYGDIKNNTTQTAQFKYHYDNGHGQLYCYSHENYGNLVNCFQRFCSKSSDGYTFKENKNMGNRLGCIPKSQ